MNNILLFINVNYCDYGDDDHNIWFDIYNI